MSRETLVRFRSNGYLHEAKTQNILFSWRQTHVNNTEYLDSVKFLGIIIDNNFTWNDYIKFISKWLSRVIFLLTFSVHQIIYVKTSYYDFSNRSSDME